MNKIDSVISSKDNSFDMIRLLASLLVLYAHAYHIFGLGADPLTPYLRVYSGTVAVYVFFCISGFFIAKSAAERTSREYWIARCARIFPALLFCNLITVIMIVPFIDSQFSFTFMSNEGLSYIYKNTSLLSGLKFIVPGVLDSHPDQALNGSLWTLPFELQAYIVIFYFGAFGILLDKLKFNLVLITLIYIYYFQPQFLNYIIPLENARELFIAFFIGAALYVNRDWIPLSYASFVTTLLIFIAAHFYNLNSLKFISGCYLVIAFGWLFRSKYTKFKKDYSYGVYLYAYPMSQLGYHLFGNDFQYYFIFIVISTFCLSIISWELIETKFMSLSRRKMVKLI